MDGGSRYRWFKILAKGVLQSYRRNRNLLDPCQVFFISGKTPYLFWLNCNLDSLEDIWRQKGSIKSFLLKEILVGN